MRETNTSHFITTPFILRASYRISSSKDINDFIQRIDNHEEIKHLIIDLDQYSQVNELDIRRLKERLLQYNNIETFVYDDDISSNKIEIANIVINLLSKNNFQNLIIVKWSCWTDLELDNLIFEAVISSSSIKIFHIMFADKIVINNEQIKSLFNHPTLKDLSFDLSVITDQCILREGLDPSIIQNTKLVRFSSTETIKNIYKMLDGLFYNKNLIFFKIDTPQPYFQVPGEMRERIEHKVIDILKRNKYLLSVGQYSNSAIVDLLINNRNDANNLRALVEDNKISLNQGTYLKLVNGRSAIEFLLSNPHKEQIDNLFMLLSTRLSSQYDIQEYMDYYLFNISEEAKTIVSKKLKEAENNTLLTLGVCKKLNPESTLMAIFFPHIMEKIFSYDVIKDNITQFVVNKEKVVKKYQEACTLGDIEKVKGALEMMTHETFRDRFENPEITRIVSEHRVKNFSTPKKRTFTELVSSSKDGGTTHTR